VKTAPVLTTIAIVMTIAKLMTIATVLVITTIAIVTTIVKTAEQTIALIVARKTSKLQKSPRELKYYRGLIFYNNDFISKFN
jgi:hypothetical protein